MPALLSASRSRSTVRGDPSSSAASSVVLSWPRAWSRVTRVMRRLARMLTLWQENMTRDVRYRLPYWLSSATRGGNRDDQQRRRVRHRFRPVDLEYAARQVRLRGLA